MGLDVPHSFYEKAVGSGRAENTQEAEEDDVSEGQVRANDEEERNKEKGGEEILEESNQQARESLREFSVEDGEHRKSYTRKDSPEDTAIDGVFELESGDDEENAKNTQQGIKDIDLDQSFPEKKRLQEGGQHGVAGEGEKPDSHRGNLDRLEEGNPVDGKKTAKKEKEQIVFGWSNP